MMRIGKLLSTAILKWLFIFCYFGCMGATMSVYAQGGEKAPAAIAGKYVIDNTVAVPAGAYTTFSTVYEGKRYYLGIDTTRAKAIPAKDTVAWYDQPNYASMWVVGGLYNPRATSSTDVLPDKNYQRAIESLWIRERCSRKKYLALGDAPTGVMYNPLILRDSSTATPNGNVAIWYTQKDDREPSKYINGFLYYYSNASGIDVYRYLRYDPIYGFSRAYAAKPDNSQRISVWDRKIGSDLHFDIRPKSIPIGWETHDKDTTNYQITAKLTYYESIDRFRSRFDNTDIFASRSAAIEDQQKLVSTHGLTGYYVWKSNPSIDPEHPETYNGKSLMPYYGVTSYDDSSDPENPVVNYGWLDSTMVYVREDGFSLKTAENLWYDTIFAIGSAPFDMLRKPAGGGAPTPGNYANHTDQLYIKFTCDGVQYTDSVLVTRETYHNNPFVNLETASDPTDKVFPYTYTNLKLNPENVLNVAITAADTAATFNISALYSAGNEVQTKDHIAVSRYVGEEMVLNLDVRCHRDTIWEYDEDGNVEIDPITGDPIYSDIVLYDTLLVRALEPDGVTPSTWVENVRLTARNQIRVKVLQSNPDVAENRVAQIQYTYRYWHSSAKGDQKEVTRSIWITQKWHGADNAKLYTFNHKGTLDAKGLQAVHEKVYTMYAIPSESHSLPLHRDHWGYYRWFIYDGDHKDRDVEHGTWRYTLGKEPKNNRGEVFIPINNATSTTSRGQWDMSMGTPNHFIVGDATPIPAINYGASATDTIDVACDVSAYIDTAAVGVVGSLKSLTEPTLSYRNVFQIKPAKRQADKMADCRVNGGTGHNGWMEDIKIIAPAKRTIGFFPKYPIAENGSDIVEDHLQYIYYFNPDASGHVDNNMGVKNTATGYEYDKTKCYARIGKKYKTGDSTYRAQLLSPSNITIGRSKPVIMVNPRKGTGFVIGKNGSGFTTIDLPDSVYNGNATTLQHFIEDEFLNTTEVRDAFKMTLERPSTNEISIKNGNDYLQFDFSDGLLWSTASGRPDRTMDYSAAENSGNYITNTQSTSVKLWMHAAWWLDILVYREGYMMTYDYSKTCIRRNFWGTCLEYRDDYTRNIRIQGNLEDDKDESNRGWLFYEIIEPDEELHYETPTWYRSTNLGLSWEPVAHWDYDANEGVQDRAGHTMGADASLLIDNTVYKNENETIVYCLRTEHFNLAKVTLVTRDIKKEGPNPGQGSIISEDDVQNNYTILYDLGMDEWPKPGTTEVRAHNHHMPWGFTELSYHYPLSEIPAFQRVNGDSELPAKGEYAFINKFVVPEGEDNEGEEIECLDGAGNGYMMCIHAAPKRTTIMRFEYPAPSCSDQQIYLVADYCNPTSNAYQPMITADLEGWTGTQWKQIYRYKTGKIPYKENGKTWCQMALPIARDSIKGYAKFRCTATLNGSGTTENAFLLIDHLRFIEKNRAFSVFQNKANCIKDDSVTVLVRLNYKADPVLYEPGKLVACQFQKWDNDANDGAGGYVPMKNAEIRPGYLQDGFSSSDTPLKTTMGNDYGFLLIPEANYDPSASNTVGGQSALRNALITAAQAKGASSTAAPEHSLDETGSVRSFEQVIAHDYEDFGTSTNRHIKSFVKMGDDWMLYLNCRLPIAATDNGTFRIGMTTMMNLDDTPTFDEEHCATFHIFNIKQTTSLLVNDAAWPNHTRAELTGSTPELTLLPANETQRASIKLTIPSSYGGKPVTNPRCKFDLLHASEDVRADNAASNAAFEAKYHCTRFQFIDDMEAFRADDERNIMRDMTNWSAIRPEYFTYTGRTPAVANAIYNRLNYLVTSGLLEIGLDYRDIYMGDKADSYFYLLPVPATGLFDVTNGNKAGNADTTLQASVCNDTLWLQLHSEEPEYKLRYGYDSRVGDTYIVPTIRATRSEANGLESKDLKVRVAHITSEDTKAAVLGWQTTKLIETNDPSWSAGDAAEEFYYVQDKNVQSPATNLDGYYKSGDIVHFTPKTGTTFRLKAGYWYRFSTPFFGVTDPNTTYSVDETVEDNIKGHSQFILAVAPDTVRWTPAHPDAANYWNDDANWTPVMASAPADGFKAKVPMGDTKVIIPEMAAANTLPIVNNTVPRRIDTLDYGFKKNTCKDILFKPRSTILGQEMLDYERAFVDVPLATAEYMTFSPALKYIYAGDMYIPKVADNVDFDPKEFKDPSTSYSASYNRKTPYAMYAAYYNQTVNWAYYNTDTEGNELSYKSRSSADWVFTNTMKMPLTPGTACLLLAYDKTGEDKDSVIVRLPKKETHYPYIGKKPDGTWGTGAEETMEGKPAFGDLSNNLAFNKTDLAEARTAAGSETAGITYTLTNETPSKVFFFGNPTMALIDVYKLCQDNSSKLDKGGTGTSYYFTAYHLREGEASYSIRVINGPGQFFVAPQRSVGLIAASPGTELEVELRPEALVAMADGSAISIDTISFSAPARRAAYQEPSPVNWLYMSAANETDGGLCKAYLTIGQSAMASRNYVAGEDALNLSSGTSNNVAYETPLSMYTIAGNEALMLDVRDSIGTIPLVFATLPDYEYEDYTLLSFAFEGHWSTPLYLYDALTNDSIQITNGLQVAVRTPESDQIRYFINGNGARTTTDGGQPGVTTDIDEVDDQLPTANNQSAIIYDVLGRPVLNLSEHDLISNIQLPTGVYIIQRGKNTERMVIR